MSVQVTLIRGKAERFCRLRDGLEEQLGYRPTRPEMVGLPMVTDVDLDDTLEWEICLPDTRKINC